MKNKKIFSLLLALVPVYLAIVPATIVLAAGPDVQTVHEEASYVAADCGDLLAIGEFVADVRITTFFDTAGNPVRAQVQINYDGTMTNSLTGVTLRDPTHLTVYINLQDGTQTETGLFYGIKVPGQGVAVLDAGKVVFDADGNVLFVSGPHQFLDGGEALICAALD